MELINHFVGTEKGGDESHIRPGAVYGKAPKQAQEMEGSKSGQTQRRPEDMNR